ncbi:MAG: hypothetical protein HY307_01470 [Arcobacter sp.]|nr:hypothetical protein [Arcobacter sp.]
MKSVTEFLSEKGFIFSDFRKIGKQALNTKKQIDIFSGCDIKNHFISVFIVRQKNRFISKDATVLNELKEKLILLEDHNFKQNILLITGDICGKSTKYLSSNNWKIYNDFV